MMNILRSLFRSAPSPSEGDLRARAHERAYGRLNEISSIINRGDASLSAPPSPRAISSYLLRDPLLDRNERIAGYEFSLDRQKQMRFKDRGAVIRKVHDDTLMRVLSTVQVDRLLVNRLAIVEVSAASVADGISSRMPRGNTVVVLDFSQQASLKEAVALASIGTVVNAGFRVGWKLGELSEDIMAILTCCEFVQIDTPGFDGVQLKELARKLRRANRPGRITPIRLIARDVQTSDDFQLCFRAGFDYFQGPFVTNRENWTPPRSDIDRVRVIQILNRLRNGAGNAVIARELRMEPILTYKLLRYVNSTAMGSQGPIGTIDQALLAISGQQLYRWLSLLLFDMKVRGFAERTLIEQVLVRARMMASLCAGTVDPELAFLTGTLSLLDRLLGRPIADLLPQISVPAEVKDALIAQTGPYAHLLDLAVACEQSDQGLIAVTAAVCGLDESAVNAQLIAAMNWAYEVMSVTD